MAGSSLVTKELQLIAKEVLTPSAARGVYGRFKTTDDLIDFLASNPAFQKLQRTNQVATQLYQLGDDIWKIYSYAFELQKLRNAKAKIGTDFADNASLRRQQLIEFGKHIGKRKGEGIDEAMRRAAADTVRNTVPNY